MEIEDNHNHFCIYCGAKLIENQHFCSECGKEVFQGQSIEINVSSKYDSRLIEIKKEYNLKQTKASQLVEKLFPPDHIAYTKFTSIIEKSNRLFANHFDVTQKMVELDVDNNELVEKEIENKISILSSFVDKMNELINELIIHIGSNKKDDDDINNLFNDMDDLINSIKNY